MRIGVFFLASLRAAVPAAAESLQEGDIVIGAGSSVLLMRDGEISTLMEGPFGGSELIVDSQGRIVFFRGGNCGNNSYNQGLYRADPVTGEIELLACLPRFPSADNVPPGFPPDIDYLYGVAGLHLTRSHHVVIDDQAGGQPQASYEEAYGFAVRVNRNGETVRLVFNYLPEQDLLEEGISIAPFDAGNLPMIFVEGDTTWFGASRLICKAKSPIVIDVNFGSVSGVVELAGSSTVVYDSETLDNTTIPNETNSCGDVTDTYGIDPPPYELLDGITNFGFLNGELFVASSSAGAGHPYLFDIRPRSPYLNPILCVWYETVEHFGPYDFFEGVPVPDFGKSITVGDRMIGTSYWGQSIFEVSPDSYSYLWIHDTPLGDLAAYPPDPGTSAGALLLRADANVNVLVTDPSGRRLGIDADGTVVNDFGADAQIVDFGVEGAPFVLAIGHPIAGEYDLQITGTDDGPYTMVSYLADTSAGGATIESSGDTEIGLVEHIDLEITLPLDAEFQLPCPADLDDDDVVDIVDFLALLAAWGLNPGHPADVNGNGNVGIEDFLAVLAAWGGCP